MLEYRVLSFGHQGRVSHVPRMIRCRPTRRARGVTVVSGLAKGVNTTALTSAISNGGQVVAVIGTSLDKAYPAENAKLQRQIYADHV